MFKINYQITDKMENFENLTLQEIEEGAHVEGFLEIVVNESSYGYCPSEVLPPEVEGAELLTNWFESLLRILIHLKKGNQYVAINDIDAYKSWVEFRKIDNRNICISEVYSNKEEGVSYLVFTQPKNAEYDVGSLYHQIVPLDEIEQEIKIKTLSYLEEIEHLSQELAEGRTMLSLKKLYNEVFNPENRH
jgi:hypothetical protein